MLQDGVGSEEQGGMRAEYGGIERLGRRIEGFGGDGAAVEEFGS